MASDNAGILASPYPFERGRDQGCSPSSGFGSWDVGHQPGWRGDAGMLDKLFT